MMIFGLMVNLYLLIGALWVLYEMACMRVCVKNGLIEETAKEDRKWEAIAYLTEIFIWPMQVRASIQEGNRMLFGEGEYTIVKRNQEEDISSEG